MSKSKKGLLQGHAAQFLLAAVAVAIAAMLAYGSPSLTGQLSNGIRIVDDSDTKLFRVTAGNVFAGQAEPNAYHGDRTVAQHGTHTSVSWNFGAVPVGTYDVLITWPNLSGNDSVVPYKLVSRNQDGSVALLHSFTIDQTKDPVNDHNAGGRPFQKVGTVNFTGTSMYISLKGTPQNGKYYEFDAVMIKPAQSTSSASSWISSSSSSLSSLPKCPAEYPLCTALWPHMDCANGGMPRDEYSTIDCTYQGKLGKCYRSDCPVSSSSKSSFISSRSSSSYVIIIDPCPPFCPPSSSSSKSSLSSLSSVPFVDLKVSMWGPTMITREQPALFRFSVQNIGTMTDESVTFVDPLQGNFILEKSTGATCVQSNNQVTCSPFALGPNASRTIDLTFRVPQIENCVTKTVNHQVRVVGTREDPSRLDNNLTPILKSTVLCPSGSSSSNTAMKVYSPNGGETFTEGTNFEIRWNRTGQPVSLGLVDKRFETNPEAILGWINNGNESDSSTLWDGVYVSDAAGTVVWKVSDLSKGPFKILAYAGGCIWSETGGCNTDLSDGYFNIVQPTSSSTSSVSTRRLDIVVKTLASQDTAVRNQKNVKLLRFEAKASESEDLLLTKVIVDTVNGSLLNAQNYALWTDTDNDQEVDTIVQAGVSPAGSLVRFDAMAGGGYIIDRGATQLFEVRADIASSLANDTLQLRLATGTPNYIEAETLNTATTLNGVSTNNICTSTSCQIFVWTTESTVYHLVSQGDLYVTRDSTPLRNRQLLGGSLENEILRLQFHAENEAIDVTDLQLTSSGSTAGSIDRLELYREGSTTPFASATVSGCTSDPKITTNPGTSNSAVQTFCANMESQQLVIPEGSDVDVLVRPRMKTDLQGAISNQKIALFVGSGIGTANKTVQARGIDSSNALSMSDGDSSAEGEVFIGRASPGANAPIVGVANITVLSKIISILNGNSDPNGTAIPEGPNRILGQFTFKAAPNTNTNNGLNYAVPRAIVFNVIAQNVNLDSTTFAAFKNSDSTVLAPCYPYSPTGMKVSNPVSGSFIIACNLSGIRPEMNSGESVTIALRGNVLATQLGGNSSTLQVSLTNFASMQNYKFSPSQSHLYWLDRESATTRGAFFWVEYPTNIVTSTTYVSG